MTVYEWDAGCECGWFAHGRGADQKDAEARAREVFERHQQEQHGRKPGELREKKVEAGFGGVTIAEGPE